MLRSGGRKHYQNSEEGAVTAESGKHQRKGSSEGWGSDQVSEA